MLVRGQSEVHLLSVNKPTKIVMLLYHGHPHNTERNFKSTFYYFTYRIAKLGHFKILVEIAKHDSKKYYLCSQFYYPFQNSLLQNNNLLCYLVVISTNSFLSANHFDHK